MWTIDLLENFFSRNGVQPSAYGIYLVKEDAFCILKEESLWKIVYVERGALRVLGFADNESQALNLLKLFVMESEKGFR
jgi:hypothetical protein